MAWGNIPLLAQTLRQNTGESPMKDCVDAARAAERSGLLAATAFGGFQAADIHDAGLSVVAVADGDLRKAQSTCQAILDIAWTQKEQFIYRGEPLEQALVKAQQLAAQTGGPILLLDHADNCASGATQDTMYVLKAALQQGLTGIAVGPVRDPEAVAQMIKAGVGAKVTVELGGKMNMPAIKVRGEPLELTGVVRAITDGEYTITGPQFQGMRCYMGHTAVLDTGAAQIVDPSRKRFLLLKSRMYFRPVFLPIAKGMVFCDSIGVGSSDWTRFEYRKLRRPIYPLDAFPAEHR
jgi:microcystin degradation protein MlrC